MSDFKSRLPDFKEITNFASKLFKDVKKSVEEIIEDYKSNRPDTPPEATTHDVTSSPKDKEDIKTEKSGTTKPVDPVKKTRKKSEADD